MGLIPFLSPISIVQQIVESEKNKNERRQILVANHGQTLGIATGPGSLRQQWHSRVAPWHWRRRPADHVAGLLLDVGPGGDGEHARQGLDERTANVINRVCRARRQDPGRYSQRSGPWRAEQGRPRRRRRGGHWRQRPSHTG